MALFHVATITPSKADIIGAWAPLQPWGPEPGSPITTIGSYRFDDPEGRVGMETFLVTDGDEIFQIPLTYRDTPLDDGDALVATTEHSVLGTRWVYDGVRDPLYVTMLAAVSMTGQGEALGLALHDGRWHIAPSSVRIRGGGWSLERVPTDRFVPANPTDAVVTLTSDRFELDVHRRPTLGAQPAVGMTATWPGQPDAVVLTTMRVVPDPG